MRDTKKEGRTKNLNGMGKACDPMNDAVMYVIQHKSESNHAHPRHLFIFTLLLLVLNIS